MSDPVFPFNQAPGNSPSPVTIAALVLALQNLVEATNAQAQNIKANLGVASSGDISGSYPGPITVTATHLNAPLPVSQGGTGNGTGQPAGAAGGDLTGQYPDPVIAAGAVIYAKIQNVAGVRLLGNPAGAAASMMEIALGPSLSFLSGELVTQAITGDVEAAAGSFDATVVAINGVALGSTAAGTGHLLVGSGLEWITQSVSGDATLAANGHLTVTGAGGTAFGPYAAAAAGQLPGTATNDNAAAGDIGQDIESVVASGAAIALTTATALSVTNVILTPGDWDVWAYIGFTGGTSTTVNSLVGSISLTNNTLDQTRTRWGSQVPGGATIFNTLANQQFACGQDRISVATNTSVYLVARAAFGASTCSAFGAIIARRRR